MQIKQGTPLPNCSIARALRTIGDEWSFLILREAHNGLARYVDMQRTLGIATNVLTDRLRGLVSSGILERREYRDEQGRTRYSYHLTPPGKDTKVVLGALQEWGDIHVPRRDGPTVLRRDQQTRELARVGFVDKNGIEISPERISFEPVVKGHNDEPTSSWR